MPNLNTLVVVILLSVSLVRQSAAVEGDGRKTKEVTAKLYHDLFDNRTGSYDKRVRPVDYMDESVKIFMVFRMISLVDLNEKEQTMTTLFSLETGWVDAFLTWDSEEYGGTQAILVRQQDVWLPDVKIMNSVNIMGLPGYKELPMYLQKCGSINWAPDIKSTTSCDIDITYYPFDSQVCYIDIGTAYTMDYELRIFSHNTAWGEDPNLGLIMSQYEEDGSWDIIDYNVDDLRNNDMGLWVKEMTRYSFVLKRKEGYYILNLVLPVLFLSCTSTLVFALPADAGEKMGTSITVLLAYAVYLTIVQEWMPQTSLQVSWLSLYLTLLLGLCALSVVLSAFVLRIHFKSEEHPVGEKLARVTTWVNGKKKEKKKNGAKNGAKNYAFDNEGETPLEGVENSKLEVKVTDVTVDLEKDEDKVTWQDVAKAVDWVFFLTSTLINIVVTIAFGVVLVVGGKNAIPVLTKDNVTDAMDFKDYSRLIMDCNGTID